MNKYLQIFKNYKRLCVDRISEFSNFSELSDDYIRQESKRVYGKLIKEFKDIDFTQFTIDELKELDFSMWDDEIILMPMWAIDCLKDGTEVTSIGGVKKIFSKKEGLDKDTRFGSTAWGFTTSQLRDGKLDNILN